MDKERNRQTSKALWQLLYERNWDAMADLFAPDCLYQDVPTPDFGARGPDSVIRRLKIGHEPVERHEHHLERMVAEGDCVITEHLEDWYFHTGEVVKLPFTSIHEFDESGRITLWRDYWDLGTLLNNAPTWWLEQIMAANGEEFGQAGDAVDE